MGFSWSLFVAAAFFVLQDKLGHFFSENHKVWEICGQLSILVGVMYCLMTIFYLSLAVLSGIARPTIVMIGFVLGCYFVGIPTTYAFGFKIPPSALSWWPHFNASEMP